MGFNFFYVVLIIVLTVCSSSTAALIPGKYDHMSAQDLLEEGLGLHEAGKSSESLVFFNLAYKKFSQQGNIEKAAETIAAKSLPLRRLNRLEEATEALQKAVELTKDTGATVLPLYNLAKVQQELSQPVAVETYQQALEAMIEYKPVPHYREAVLNDMRLHIAIAQLIFDRNPGDAEEQALLAIEALRNDPELDGFGRDVWMSGGYLGLAEYFSQIDTAKAWAYFDQAECIVIANEALTLRRDDLENLRKDMPPRPGN